MDFKILDHLQSEFFNNIGFVRKLDKDNNLSYSKELPGRGLIIWSGYRNDYFWGASSSIVFKELQKLYTDLCHHAMARDVRFAPNKKWLEEQYNSSSINSNIKVQSPAGVLNSRFKGYSLADHFKNDSISKIDDIDKYIDYLDRYYEQSAKPFFTSLPDLMSLDKLTDNMDNYFLSLYLTGIPPLKKIVLMHIVDNPFKEEALQKYRDQLKSVPSDNTIEALLQSLQNIETYFTSEYTMI